MQFIQNRTDSEIVDWVSQRITWESPEWIQQRQKITSLSGYIPFLGNPDTTDAFKRTFSPLCKACLIVIGVAALTYGAFVATIFYAQIPITSSILLTSCFYGMLGAAGLVVLAGLLAISINTSISLLEFWDLHESLMAYQKWVIESLQRKEIQGFRGPYSRLTSYFTPQKLRDIWIYVQHLKESGEFSLSVGNMINIFQARGNILKEHGDILSKYFPEIFECIQRQIESISPEKRLKTYGWDLEAIESNFRVTRAIDIIFGGVEELRRGSRQLAFGNVMISSRDNEVSQTALNALFNSNDLLELIGSRLDSRSLVTLARTCRAIYQRVRNHSKLGVTYATAAYDHFFPKHPEQFGFCQNYRFYFPHEPKAECRTRIASGPGWLLFHSKRNDYIIQGDAPRENHRIELIQLRKSGKVKVTFYRDTVYYSGRQDPFFLVFSNESLTPLKVNWFCFQGNYNGPLFPRSLPGGDEMLPMASHAINLDSPLPGGWMIVDQAIVRYEKGSAQEKTSYKVAFFNDSIRVIPCHSANGNLQSIALDDLSVAWVEDGVGYFWTPNQFEKLERRVTRVLLENQSFLFYNGERIVCRKQPEFFVNEAVST